MVKEKKEKAFLKQITKFDLEKLIIPKSKVGVKTQPKVEKVEKSILSDNKFKGKSVFFR